MSEVMSEVMEFYPLDTLEARLYREADRATRRLIDTLGLVVRGVAEPIVAERPPEGEPVVLQRVRFDDPVAGLIQTPQAMRSDYSSIPWIAQPIVKKFGRHNGPSVLHDHLYRHLVVPGLMERKLADDIFNRAMIAADVSAWDRWRIYAAVRAGGWWAVRKARKQQQENDT